MIAEVRLWGRRIGAVSQESARAVARFEYDPDFIRSGIQVSPLMMPLSDKVHEFPGLARETFHGLPGLLADSLPDAFGNALIDAWLAAEGRNAADFSPVERLCYTGSRAMGALEYKPVIGGRSSRSEPVRIDALLRLAEEVLRHRADLKGHFDQAGKAEALRDILRVGTSAGGARAKAVIAWNPVTQKVRSGQVKADEGFEYWLLKFDGVAGNRDRELDDPRGYGATEFAYSLMAKAAGIRMSDCRLLEEGGRRHFMTRRFDRLPDGRKLHMQSLCAIAHLDFHLAGAHSCEQALQTLRRLGLPMASVEELFRRMLFNVVARNQDDHVKNISFLMNKQGEWSLAPAYDLCYSYNPQGAYTSVHQMSLNGKRDQFVLEDFKVCATSAGLKQGRYKTLLDEVRTAVNAWADFAEQAGVPEATMSRIRMAHRLEFAAS